MGITRDIAEFTYKTTFDDFDSGLVKHVKNVLLSGVGMTMAGVKSPAGQTVIRYIKEVTTTEEARLSSRSKPTGGQIFYPVYSIFSILNL